MRRRNTRIDLESRTIAVMVSLYCHDRHQKEGLCPECAGLMAYAMERLNKCPFREGKTTCAKCPVHCYQPAMRARVRAVMRYAGPRMTYRHPVLALYHLIHGVRQKPNTIRT